MSIAFLVTTLVVVAAPGSGAIYTISAGLSQGRRASIVAAFGCTLGIVPHLLAAITGLAALLQASPVAFQILKYTGVAYLLYLAWVTLRGGDALVTSAGPQSRTAPRIVISGVLVNLLNPKLTMFFFAFLPQFVNTGSRDSVAQMLRLGSVFMVLTFVIFAGYGVFAGSVRDRVTNRPGTQTWIRRVFACCYLALGAALALAAR